MATAPVTRATARTSLLAFKRQNFDVDPDDDEHLQAYMSLRSATYRVAPKAFVKYLQSRVESVHHGEKTSVEFWAVPKTNSPKGLPAKIADAVADGGEVDDLSPDRARFFNINKVIPRDKLGKNVWTVSKYMAMSTSAAITCPENDLPPPATGGSKRATGRNLCGDAVAVVDTAPAKKQLKREHSDD